MILSGLRVVDLSEGLCAGLTAGLLADCGADVVRPVDTDPRTTGTPVAADRVVADRGKRLGTTTAASTAAVAELLAGCHVVIADRRDVLARWGLDAETTGTRVTVLVSPLDEDGAPWSGGDDAPELLAALSGLATNQSSWSGRPVDAVYPYLRYVQAGWAAACTLAALVERHRCGRGQLVTVTGQHAANLFCGFLYARPETERDVPRTDGPGGVNAMYTRYRGADGRWFFVGGLGPKFGRAVLELTGSAHLLDDPRVGGRLDRIWAAENSRWVMAHLQEVFSHESAEHWVKVLDTAGIPGAVLLTRDEWFASAQVAATGQRQHVVDPVLGDVSTPASPLWFDGRPVVVRPTAAAAPIEQLAWLAADSWTPATPPDGSACAGSDSSRSDSSRSDSSRSDSSRSDSPRSDSPRSDSPRSGSAGLDSPGAGPLHGIRVASMGSFVAGPYVGSLLTRLGADVVKIEPLEGDPWRAIGFSYNQGVRSLAVDLRSDEGRRALAAVLAGCDLLVDNFRLGVTERLGVSHQQLNDDRVPGGRPTATVSVTAYGDVGPLADRPGYDSVAQAACGIMAALGGDDEPVLTSLPNVDHTTAAVGALAATAALLHLVRTGRPVHASTSLAATAVFVQLPELTSFAGRGPRRIGGRDFAGPGALDRIYPVADGFVRLRTEQLDESRWQQAGLVLDRSGEDLQVSIGAALAPLGRAAAVAALTIAGVRAVAVRGVSEVVNDPELARSGIVRHVVAADGVRFGVAGRTARFSRTDPMSVSPAPGLGEHTYEVLADAGLPRADTDALLAAGRVACGGPLPLTYVLPYR